MKYIISEIPDGRHEAQDFLDDDGVALSRSGKRSIGIKVAVEVGEETLEIDFTGLDPQVKCSVNAVYASILSVVYYVLKCLALEAVPSSVGLICPVTVVLPLDSVVNAAFPAATAAGNVATAQRIVDVLLRALSSALPDQIPAASSGTMNNLSVGGIQARGKRKTFVLLRDDRGRHGRQLRKKWRQWDSNSHD